ncbi:MAG TPA: winged helix-turn-helix domain-containing protein [Candidatus Acidoferrum sp.]|nr:winged helix-turn-helix domain-containing protein [Candidatus Acidoferrum sp.]
MTNAPGERLVRFGIFQLNPAARELRKHGIKVRLSGQPFTILEMLLEKPGQVVTRDDLQKHIWPADTFVDFEQGLNSAIKKLRDALGDSAETPRYVETLPRIGYRFIAPVGDMGAALSNELPATTPATSPEKSQETDERRVSRAMLLAVLGIATIAVAAIGWALVNHYGTRAVLFHEKDTVVVGSFENFTAEPTFDDALRQALIVGMRQTPFLQVLSEHRAAEILRQMGHGPEERLTAKTSVELCQRVGSKVVTEGAIRTLGTSYVLSLSAIRCDKDESIAQEQVVAGRKEDVIDALGQAAARIRAKLGESLPSLQKYNAPLEQATTSSLEALKAYGLGAERWDSGEDRGAQPYFEQAVELDPKFAMAYGALAAIHENDGEHELAKQAATKAYENKERATGVEKLLIESWYDIYVTGDIEKAARLYEIGVRDYPDNTRMLNDLGVIEASLGNYSKGAELFRAVVQRDPGSAATYGNLSTSLLALGKSEEAQQVLDEAEKKQLPLEDLQQVRYWTAFARHDSSTMQRLVEQSADEPLERAELLAEQAQTAAYEGRLNESRSSMEAAYSLMLREGDQETAATFLAQGAVRVAEFGEAAEAKRLTARALKLSRGPDVVVLAAIASARSGDAASAEKLSRELNTGYPAHTQIQKYWLPLIRAQIDIAQNEPAKAISALETATPYEMAAPSALSISSLYPAYVRGVALLRLGDAGKAATEFQKLADHPAMVLNCPLGSLAQLGLARSAAQEKQYDKAKVAYRDLLQTWQGADPNVRTLQQAKEEFAKLPAQ